MKPLRLNKVIGISIGERSLLAAEVVAGDKPEVKRLAEFVYPEGITPQQPVELGAALGAFLRENNFTAKSAIVGLPARWLVVKSKDVPPADPTTLANLLRLQAEGEFSTELKDLVYDYSADVSGGNPKCVLLIATAKKYVDAATAMCEAAKLNAAVVTSSAIALGTLTGRSVQSKNPLVLLVSPAGAELTAQCGTAPSAIRHLRGPGPDRPFVGELRRAISGMPAAGNGALNGSPRELVLWDAAGASAFDSTTLGQTLNLNVRSGDLPILGVNASAAASNGEGRKFAAAVALALVGMGEDSGEGFSLGSMLPGALFRGVLPATWLARCETLSNRILKIFHGGPVSLTAAVAGDRAIHPVDFLHSRLAPVPAPKIPRWVKLSSLAGMALLLLIYLAYSDMQDRQAKLDKINAQIDSKQDDVKRAQLFVDKVSFAQAWHMGTPRYLSCLADLTLAIPQDGQTYAMSLTLREDVPAVNSSGTMKAPTVRTLSGRLDGKTTDQRRAQQVLDQLKSRPDSFRDVKSGGTQDAGKGREVSFTVTFTYIPPKGT